MPRRSYASATGYRYGFNGKENDNNSKGLGNQQDYENRIYDPRVGRFLSMDPIAVKYPELTPYQFASNRPIDGMDQDGLEWLGSEERQKTQSSLSNSNQNTSKSVILIQQGRSGNVLSSFWGGVQDSYSDTKHAASISSLKKGWDNLLGTGKDLVNMSEGKPGAAKSFTNRVANVSKGVTNSIVEPSLFLANVYRQSPQENAYGIGYYGFQIGVGVAMDRFIADMEAPGMSLKGSSLFESFESGGTKLVSSEMLRQFPGSKTFGSSASTFISPTSEVNSLLSKGFNRNEIAAKIGITDPNFLKGDLFRIDVSSSLLRRLNLRVPNGSEIGVNSLFQLGAKTPGGITEGVVNGIPKTGIGMSVRPIK